MTEGNDRETEAYLARIRRTIEESNRLVDQVDLRIRETDRLLEQQGLTREQVMAMHFSDAQIEAANEELKRRGLDPIEKWTMDDYEAWFDHYCEVMKKYEEDSSDLELLSEMTELLSEETTMLEEMENMDQSDMNAAELAYYLEVTARIENKLLEATY